MHELSNRSHIRRFPRICFMYSCHRLISLFLAVNDCEFVIPQHTSWSIKVSWLFEFARSSARSVLVFPCLICVERSLVDLSVRSNVFALNLTIDWFTSFLAVGVCQNVPQRIKVSTYRSTVRFSRKPWINTDCSLVYLFDFPRMLYSDWFCFFPCSLFEHSD